ncbi:PadR family transcriptional regulator [Brevibacillus choshinensis]|uniref:PadR family transcriptional regulator n=1 Tax=Brevibacillus choshinensis TaxID=54911 RepID=UPI002E1EB662|nr:PadR family transcriptional regulator [Brevibacillus choshinensis]
MKNNKKNQLSPLAIAVLALLAEEPMHPYRMQALIKERGKDDVINVRQRTNIYQTIDRLLRDGFIAVSETLREEGRPDRTVYAITALGRKGLKGRILEILSTPTQEFPEFPAAVSFLALLTVEEVQQQLEKREAALFEQLNDMDAKLQTYKDTVPRLFMLEVEYQRTVLFAELEWVRSVAKDIRMGSLVWDGDWLRDIETKDEG